MTIEPLDLTPSPQSEITTSADELTSVTSMTSSPITTMAPSLDYTNMTTPPEMNMTTYKTKTMSPAKDTEALLRPITSPESMKEDIKNSTQSDPDCRKSIISHTNLGRLSAQIIPESVGSIPTGSLSGLKSDQFDSYHKEFTWYHLSVEPYGLILRY